MRPLNLTMNAYGPYAKTVTLNMTDLGEKGIYLITGDTGSGKTTIFDAICYALYGEASSDRRSDASMLISKYSDPSEKTYVELTFSCHEKIYTVRRSPEQLRLKRGGGYTTSSPEAELIFPDERQPITKSKEVTKEIERIVGIDRDQFVSIAMIAQGDFLKLLLASTQDRSAIFRKIFSTGIYQTLQDNLKKLASEKSQECKSLLTVMSQMISGVIVGDAQDSLNQSEQLEDFDTICKIIDGCIDSDERKLNELTSLKSDLKNRYHDNTAKLGIQQELERMSLEVKKRKLTLLQKQEIFNKLTQELDKTEELSKQKSKLLERRLIQENSLYLYDDHDKLVKEASSKKLAIDSGAFNTEKMKSELSKKTQMLEQMRSDTSQSEGLAVKAAELKACVEKDSQRRKQLGELRQLISRLNAAYSSLKAAQDAFLAADAKYSKANSELDALTRAYLSDRAGLLASTLEPEMPCPVCGSLEHPHPAKRIDSSLDEATVNLKNSEVKKLEEERSRISDSASRINGSFKELYNHAKELCFEVLGVEKPQGVSPVIAEEIEKLDMSSAKTKAELDRTEKMLKEREQKLIIVPILEDEIVKLTGKISQSENETSKIRGEYSSLLLRIRQSAEKLAFSQKSDAIKNIAKLKNAEDMLSKQIDEVKAAHAECCEEITALKSSIESISEHLKDYDSSSLIDLTAEHERLNKELNEIEQKIYSVCERLNVNKRAGASIFAAAKELSLAQSQAVAIKTLCDTANGNLSGKEKVSLEAYVQARYFDRIIQRANVHLMTMTNGQYELKRSAQAANKRSQTGLELNVTDHYIGSDRSVRSLSGGESFKASLALALGLSDEVMSSSGGISLDCMFVDEGFGSLDEKSLESAMDALISLGNSNRLVGIISHVEALKERIERKIVVVKKASEGSDARIV